MALQNWIPNQFLVKGLFLKIKITIMRPNLVYFILKMAVTAIHLKKSAF